MKTLLTVKAKKALLPVKALLDEYTLLLKKTLLAE
jgi:hypothetical protein